jgi:hypothetical protein
MSTAENAKIQYESGQDLVAFVALTDQGDHKDFRSADNFWSGRSGYVPDIKPNGLATGCAIIPAASATKEAVDVAAGTAYLAGVLTTITADTDVLVVRPAASPAASCYKKDSITINSGGSIAVVEGTAGSAFSTTRGAAGGPPFIPTTSIEIGQVWMTSASTAVIASTEIKQVIGTHCERYDYPSWTVKYFNASNGILGYAGIVFDAALPAIHDDSSPWVGAAKKVYAQYYEPAFTDINRAVDFVPPETTHTVSSKQIYGLTLGASSSSLNQGSFTAYLTDGIKDGLLSFKGDNLFFKFFQNRDNSTPYLLQQGILGVSRTFPAGDQIQAACTISAEEEAVEVVS